MSRKFFTAYPHLRGLNTYSLTFAKAINKLRPTWLGYAQYILQDQYHNENYLEIKIPSPNLEFDHYLYFASLQDRLTLGFAGWHTHFDDPKGLDEKELARALKMIQEIMDDALIFACRFPTEAFKHFWGDCWTQAEIEELNLDEYDYLCSWTGKYNRVIHPERMPKSDGDE